MKELPLFCVLLVSSGIFGCSQAYASEPVNAAQSPQQSVEQSQPPATSRGSVDCSASYGGKSASCVPIACNAQQLSFIGTWKGDFQSYVRELSKPGKPVYRPYHEAVSYSRSDCLKNIKTGDTFIIGHETSHYPAFRKLPVSVKKDLLVSGQNAEGMPFLRTVRDEGAYNYKLVYRNMAAGLSVWRLSLPASHGQPAMTYTTIDARDLLTPEKHKRNVAVTLTVGSADEPYWQGLVAYGSHTLQEK